MYLITLNQSSADYLCKPQASEATSLPGIINKSCVNCWKFLEVNKHTVVLVIFCPSENRDGLLEAVLGLWVLTEAIITAGLL